jgi:hypothetical protein
VLQSRCHDLHAGLAPSTDRQGDPLRGRRARRPRPRARRARRGRAVRAPLDGGCAADRIRGPRARGLGLLRPAGGGRPPPARPTCGAALPRPLAARPASPRPARDRRRPRIRPRAAAREELDPGAAGRVRAGGLVARGGDHDGRDWRELGPRAARRRRARHRDRSRPPRTRRRPGNSA